MNKVAIFPTDYLKKIANIKNSVVGVQNSGNLKHLYLF
jgi:hypothetical protein